MKIKVLNLVLIGCLSLLFVNKIFSMQTIHEYEGAPIPLTIEQNQKWTNDELQGIYHYAKYVRPFVGQDYQSFKNTFLKLDVNKQKSIVDSIDKYKKSILMNNYDYKSWMKLSAADKKRLAKAMIVNQLHNLSDAVLLNRKQLVDNTRPKNFETINHITPSEYSFLISVELVDRGIAGCTQNPLHGEPKKEPTTIKEHYEEYFQRQVPASSSEEMD